MRIRPGLFRHLMNLWAPFRGAGIWVEYIAPDWREVKVCLKLHWYNRNAVGTHFGGSLFSITDPFYMLMYMHVLGPEYRVWDLSSSIDFVRPGKGIIRAHFQLSEQDIQKARRATAGDSKYQPQHSVQLINADQQLVAEVKKTIYIRRKPARDKTI